MNTNFCITLLNTCYNIYKTIKSKKESLKPNKIFAITSKAPGFPT